MKLSRGEHIFWIAAVSALIFFAFLLYFDFNRQLASVAGKPVGKLTFKLKKAQRKYAAQVVWEDLEQEILLYNRDSIRTADMSEAVITLNDNTQIRLDANSMIILNITDKKIDINYAYGSIQAKRKAGSSQLALRIKTSDNKIITIKDSDVKLSQTKGEKLKVTASRGEAKIEIGGKEETLKKDQVALLSEKTIEIRPLSLRLLRPVDNRRFFTIKRQMSVNFAWSPVKNSPSVTLQVSRNAAFRRNVVRRRLRANQARIKLRPGIFYWRIQARNRRTKKLEKSAIFKFIVSGNKILQISSPASKERFEYIDRAPLVHFTWSRNEFASRYRLEIAKNRNFNDPIRLESKTTGIARRLQAGSYFCRVSTITAHTEAALISAVLSFSVVKRKKLSPPQLLRPANSKNIGLNIIQKQGLLFNWRKKRTIRKSEIWISRNSSFESKISKSTSGVFLTQRGGLTEGRHYWKVRGLDITGRPQTDFSSVYNFIVVKTVPLTLIAPGPGITLAAPALQSDAIRFIWNAQSIGGNYELQIGKSKRLGKPFIKKIIGQTSIPIKRPQTGKYYWRVRLLAVDGSVITGSKIRMFRVMKLSAAPRQLYPRKNGIVNMASRNFLSFRWQGVRGTKYYRLKLFYIAGGIRTAVFDIQTGKTRYDFGNLIRLNIGSFLWTIQSIGKRNGREIPGRESSSYFRITLGKDQMVDIGPAEVYGE